MNSHLEPCLVYHPPKRKKRSDDLFSSIEKKPWYGSFRQTWDSFKIKLEDIYREMTDKMLNDIIKHIKSIEDKPLCRVPILVPLTGANVSDHEILFQLIIKQIVSTMDCHVISLQVTEDTSIKRLVENMVFGFMNFDNREDETENEKQIDSLCKNSQCPITELQYWYEQRVKNSDRGRRLYLVVSIPEIEVISLEILRKFLNILSVYRSEIPFILVFGFATTLDVVYKKVLSHSPDLFDFHVFKFKLAFKFLDNVLDKLFLTASCPLKLHGNVFDFLTTNFLSYNYSVDQFIRCIQFCMIDHFSQSEINMLCCPLKENQKLINKLSKEQITSLFHLKSMEMQKIPKKKETWELQKEIEKLLEEFHSRCASFHLTVRCLHTFSKSLNYSQLGSNIRQLYLKAMTEKITKTNEFKKFTQCIRFSAKENLLKHIDVLKDTLLSYSADNKIASILYELAEYRKLINEAELGDERGIPSRVLQSPVKCSSNVKKLLRSPRKNSGKIDTHCANSSRNIQTKDSFAKSTLEYPSEVSDTRWSLSKYSHKLLESSPVRRSPRKRNMSIESACNSLDPSMKVCENSELDPVYSPTSSPSKMHSILNSTRNSSELTSPAQRSLMDSLQNMVSVNTPKTISKFKRISEDLSTPSRSEKILGLVSGSPQVTSLTGIEKVKSDFVQFLITEFFGPCLESPTSYPLNEIFIYSNLNNCKLSLDPVPRNVLTQAMEKPQRILQCDCCEIENTDTIPKTIPDIARAYKHLREAKGSDVNMHDWLTAFNYTLQADKNLEESDVTPEVYARFMQSVRDLKFMGFIKPCKRKVDHVTRIRL